jgi:acetyltransferase-like isoleucine patch superfamily enzyme
MKEMASMQFCRISDSVRLGRHVRMHAFVNLYGCTIGDHTSLGTFVEIQKNAVIGKQCKISSHTFICEGVTLADKVFVGHNVAFINDKYPAATNANGQLQTEADWTVIPTLVETGASIGSGTVILCGVTIGAYAVIGAGSVVTKNVPAKEIWAGNPARFIRKTEDRCTSHF